MPEKDDDMWCGRLLSEMTKEELVGAFRDLQLRYAKAENDLHKLQIDRIQEMHIANYKHTQTNRYPLLASSLRFLGF